MERRRGSSASGVKKKSPRARPYFCGITSRLPTGAGEQVRNVLSGYMTVEQGLSTARVTMTYGQRALKPGPGGWTVTAINDKRQTPAR